MREMREKISTTASPSDPAKDDIHHHEIRGNDTSKPHGTSRREGEPYSGKHLQDSNQEPLTARDAQIEQLELRIRKLEEQLNRAAATVPEIRIETLHIHQPVLENLTFRLDQLDIHELSGSLNLGNNFGTKPNSKQPAHGNNAGGNKGAGASAASGSGPAAPPAPVVGGRDNAASTLKEAASSAAASAAESSPSHTDTGARKANADLCAVKEAADPSAASQPASETHSITAAKTAAMKTKTKAASGPAAAEASSPAPSAVKPSAAGPAAMHAGSAEQRTSTGIRFTLRPHL